MISFERHKKQQVQRPAIRDAHLSGVAALDEACGGLGLVAGETIEWVGEQSSGKTGALRAFIHAARARGVSVVWIDPFRQLMPYDWSERLPGHFWVVRPPQPKDSLICVEAMLRTESFGIVILDGDLPLKGNAAIRLQRLARKTNSCLVILRSPRKGSSCRVNGRLIFKSEVTPAPNGLMKRTPFRWQITVHNERSKGHSRPRTFYLSEALMSRASHLPLGTDRSSNRTSHQRRYQGSL